MTRKPAEVIRLGERRKRDKRFITTVVNIDVEQRRETILAQKENANKGRRGQPPMVNRLRALTIYCEWLLEGGIEAATDGEKKDIAFGVGPNSVMNKVASEWMNECYSKSRDERKSRYYRKRLKPESVRDALRQVREFTERSD